MAERVCPVWIGYLLLSPLRKLMQNPYKILSGHVISGMKVMDIGSAMGYFSLPLADLVGTNGKVFCIDMQEKMLDVLMKRATKANLENRIVPRVCNQNSLMIDDLKEKIDFALTFAMVHEVPDTPLLFTEIFNALKPKGHLLVSEPAGHVSQEAFENTISIAKQKGFTLIERPIIRRSLSALFQKK
jgi:ubiquinone/menaquinone biosynthesis C-methylase UbiE